MENKCSRNITFETLERAKSGDYAAMQEVIRLFKPYMAWLSMAEGKLDGELFERLVRRLMLITVQFNMNYEQK